MASLSNINGLFDVHSTGAILFSTSHGTSGQILRSNGNAAPTWVAASTVIGGPYLPLTGGTLTGATATATGISLTVGGNLFVTGTSTLTGALSGTTGSFSGLVSGITPTAAANFATKAYVDAQPQGDITGVTAGTDLSGGGTSGSVTLNNTSTLATVTGRGASTGTSTTFGSTGVNTKLRAVNTTYYTSPTYSWTNSAIQTTSIEIIDATTNNANVCATLVMHNYGDGGVKFRMGNTGDKTLYLSSGQSAGAGNPTDDNSGTYFDEMKINNAVVYHTGNLPSGSGVTSVATGSGLTGGTITSTGTLSIDSTVATLAGTQTFTGNKTFDNFFLEFNSKTLANFNDLNSNQFDVSMYDVYSLAVASTGMLSTYGTLFQVNGRGGHDKTQFAFNGGNGYIQYRKSWYPNTAWTSFRQIWDSDNLPNPTQGGPYLPLAGGTITGLTNFTKANGPVVQITKTGSAPGNNTTLLVENTYANHSWGIVQEIRGGGTTGTDRPGLLFSSPLTAQTWTTGYYQTSDDFAVTSQRGWRNQGWGTWSLKVSTAGDTSAVTSMRAPIFYDSLATAYYLDLGAGGISLYANGSVQGEYFVGSNYTSAGYTVYKGYDNWNHFIAIRGYARPGQGKSDAAIAGGHQTSFVEYAEAGSATTGWFFMGSQSTNYVQVGKITQSHSEFVGSVRSPIFYDTNTAYYVNPASGTNLNGNTRITNTKFGVSTSGTFAYSTGYGFHTIENSAVNEPVCMFYQQTTGNHYGINVMSAGNPNNTTSRFFLGQGAASERIKIYSNGNIQNANNSYGQLSDINLKENVVDATPKLDELNQVRIVNFNYIGDIDKETNTPNKQIGVIAQELEEIFPGMVYECGDTEVPTKAVKYSVLVPILVKAIQEQQVIIDDLKSRIEKLEL